MIIEIEGKEHHRVAIKAGCSGCGIQCSLYHGSCNEHIYHCSAHTNGLNENFIFLTQESYLDYIAAKLRK